MPVIRLLTTFLMISASPLSAEELRTWTDTQGRGLQGSLLRQDDATAWIRKADGTEVALPKAKLSEKDRAHLARLPKGVAKERFDTAGLEQSGWKPIPEGLKLGKLLYPSTLETQHFIIAGGPKARPALLKSHAEVAERVWADICSDLPAISTAFEGKKMLILLTADAAESQEVRSWYSGHYHSMMWWYGDPQVGSFDCEDDIARSAGLAGSALVFQIDGPGSQHLRLKWPLRIHLIAERILAQLANNPPPVNGSHSLSTILRSYGYHREKLICGRIDSFSTFTRNSGSGIGNGANWATPTKKLLKEGIAPNLADFMRVHSSNALPRDLAFGYGLMHFIHSDPVLLGKFQLLLQKSASFKKCPDAESIAEGLGFDSVGALEKAWTDHMAGDSFE